MHSQADRCRRKHFMPTRSVLQQQNMTCEPQTILQSCMTHHSNDVHMHACCHCSQLAVENLCSRSGAMRYMADPLPPGPVQVRNLFWQRFQDSKEADRTRQEQGGLKCNTCRPFPYSLRLHIMVEERWRPHFHCAFQEDWGEPFLPDPLCHQLIFPTEYDVRRGMRQALDIFMSRYRPGHPDHDYLQRLFIITTTSAPEYSHWWLRRHIKQELHPMWVSVCQSLTGWNDVHLPRKIIAMLADTMGTSSTTLTAETAVVETEAAVSKRPSDRCFLPLLSMALARPCTVMSTVADLSKPR